MATILALLKNEVLMVSVMAWVTAQVLKFFFTWMTTKKCKLERLTGAGGMPSGHSATVSSLLISMARVEGLSSPGFAISVILAMIVMYDAMGVRYAAGQQAKVINKLVDNVEKETKTEVADELKEVLGHTPLEVAAGAMLGILISIVYPILA